MNRVAGRSSQGGAVIVTVALGLLFLIGFMGIAVDFGHLFVVKTELQTAMDSCALAAAQELDRQPFAIERAKNAGKAAGNLNRVNMQSATWSGQGQLVDADITFRDQDYGATTSDTNALYAECQRTQPNINVWLLKAMGAYSGGGGAYPPTANVGASAVATRASAQTSCPLPVALHPVVKDGVEQPPPRYGYTPGDWVKLLHNQSSEPGGWIGWVNLVPDSSSGSAAIIRDQLNGFCGTRIEDKLGPTSSNGTMTTLVEPWNYRFGIYKKLPTFGTTNSAFMYPDRTGYSYTASNWLAKSNAYSDFVAKRSTNAPCASTVKNCESTINRTLNSFKDIATAAQHGQYGTSRRIVTVPVVWPNSRVRDYACMLMLHPLSIPFKDEEEVHLEFLGNAGEPGSPCTTNGFAGGSAGPLVPVLVR